MRAFADWNVLSRALVSRTLRSASVRSAGTRSATPAVGDTSRRMRLRGRAFARLSLVRPSGASQQADGRAKITPFRRGYPVKRRALCSGPPWERGGPDRRMTAWQTIERGVFIIGSFLLSSFSIVWPLVHGGGDWEMSWCASRLPLMGRLRFFVFFPTRLREKVYGKCATRRRHRSAVPYILHFR